MTQEDLGKVNSRSRQNPFSLPLLSGVVNEASGNGVCGEGTGSEAKRGARARQDREVTAAFCLVGQLRDLGNPILSVFLKC
jgi:hypothetical protein